VISNAALPDTRTSVTHHVIIEDERSGSHSLFVIAGLFPGGAPAEVFLQLGKIGSPMRGLLDMVAILLSNALQWGVPLGDVLPKLRDQNFPPQGPTSNPAIPECSSVADYLARWLELQFTPGMEEEKV